MKRQTLAAVAATLVLLPALAFAETRTYDVGPFHGLDISAGVRVIATVGAAPSVVAEARSAGDFDGLNVEVRDGILRVWRDWSIGDIFGVSRPEVTFNVATSDLQMLDVSAAASIKSAGLRSESITINASSAGTIEIEDVASASYEIDASSMAHIRVTGTCSDVLVDASSGAKVDVRSLDCDKAEVDVSSGARIEVAAREALTVDASSGGSVRVLGQPSVKNLDLSSGGSVKFDD